MDPVVTRRAFDPRALLVLALAAGSGACFEDLAAVTVTGAGATSTSTGGASTGPGGSGTATGGEATSGASGESGDLGAPAADLPPDVESTVDLVELACDGVWQSGMGVLDCPGEPGDLAGSVVPGIGADLEDEGSYPGPVLRTLPDYLTQQTFVEGRFPPHLVVAGEVLVVGVSCEAFAINCDVDWQLRVEDEGGAELGVLAEGREVFDGVANEVVRPLDDLVGQTVRVVFAVHAGVEYSSHDTALWLSPRIVRM